MTTFERFEREIPGLMDEIAPPRDPDYLDDMLRQTGRIRQRTAWASLERWLPMGVIARPNTFRAPALRPIIMLVLIAVLIATGLVLYAGAQRTRLPEPFGPARNGLILAASDEDIVAIDPVTGATTTLIGGLTQDIAPWFSRDGQHFVFLRLDAADVGSYWIANADGSGARELVRAPVDWFEWSDSGDQIVVTREVGRTTETSVVDVETGRSAVLDVGIQVVHPYWRPGHGQIVFSAPIVDAYRAYYLVNADGTGLRKIDGVSGNAINDPTLSPDGSKLAYATWEGGKGTGEQIHVLEVDTGNEVLVTPDDGYSYQDVLFSPDGTKILTKRFPPFGAIQLAVVPADGSGDVVPIGPSLPMDLDDRGRGFQWEFSPDGAQVIVYYGKDDSTWLLDVDGTGEQQLDWSGRYGITWQRLAP
jgi:dipeptidyl aminopeptidase/acylaminoacyl peptidase